MKDFQHCVDAWSPDDKTVKVKLDTGGSNFAGLIHRAAATAVAQFYGIVQCDLLSAIHAFRGLKRNLLYEDDKNADENIIVYSWRPAHDWIWSGSVHNGYPVEKSAPVAAVFVVLVSWKPQPDSMGISGSIEKWNWVAEDPQRPHAPMHSGERYRKHLWSRS